jgi:hypothetical protein
MIFYCSRKEFYRTQSSPNKKNINILSGGIKKSSNWIVKSYGTILFKNTT